MDLAAPETRVVIDLGLKPSSRSQSPPAQAKGSNPPLDRASESTDRALVSPVHSVPRRSAVGDALQIVAPALQTPAAAL